MLGIAVETLRAYPHYIAIINVFVKNENYAMENIGDTTLDWGQDLPELKKALDRRGIQEVRLGYFGAARPGHWGIRWLPASGREPGWYAISRSYLAGMWPPGDPYAWLRAREPVELVGGSIALFRVDDAAVPAGREE